MLSSLEERQNKKCEQLHLYINQWVGFQTGTTKCQLNPEKSNKIPKVEADNFPHDSACHVSMHEAFMAN